VVMISLVRYTLGRAIREGATTVPKSIKVEPHDSAIYSKLGQTYQALGQTKKAEKAFLHASRF